MSKHILYQVLARDWLGRLPPSSNSSPTLADIPDAELDRLSDLGFNWLYLLGVWKTGLAGQTVSRSNIAWQKGFNRALTAFTPDDVVGSPFAVQSYTVHSDFGGEEALADLRSRLKSRGIRLMLDFVPNHLALDHPWVQAYPQRFIQGTAIDLAADPANFTLLGDKVFAHGRDPYFPGWVDTVQLDYSSDETRRAMLEELNRVVNLCDGLRCDMAMLLLPEVFHRTWNRTALPFWPEAIPQIRQRSPDFMMMAEVYWGLEWELQQQGFDFTYDKTLYDRLLARDVNGVRSHLQADPNFLKHMVFFLENHDEPRIAEELPFPEHRAAAVIGAALPGLDFFHDGELTGARRKASIHLRRREVESPDPEIQSFYLWLLARIREEPFSGRWRLLRSEAAWNENWTASSVLGFSWTSESEELTSIVVVNFSAHDSQAYLPIELYRTPAEILTLTDEVTGQQYRYEAKQLPHPGLYVALPAWGVHWFKVSSTPA